RARARARRRPTLRAPDCARPRRAREWLVPGRPGWRPAHGDVRPAGRLAGRARPALERRAARVGARGVGRRRGARARAAAGDAAAVVAKYPPPPQAIWQAPIYACKVLYRQLELRQDLESLRRRRSPDVPLYEAALRAHDPKAYSLGLAITCAGLALASFVFFL